MRFSRRQLGGIAIGTLAAAMVPKSVAAALAAARVESTVNGVQLGVCVGSYRDIPRSSDQRRYVAALADACAASGAGLVEYHNSQLEPNTRLYARARAGEPELTPLTPAELHQLREDRRSWRINTPISYFEDVRAAFEAAGTIPFAYSFNFTNDMTDNEIESTFRATRGLGVEVISTNATSVDMAPRLAPLAKRFEIDLGFHNHANAEDPNEIASLESFETVFATSSRCKANLDVGHFVAANLDPIAFIERNHARITHLHFKDRSRNKGPNVPWGQGETPLAEILLLIRKNKYRIPCLVEYEYYRYPGTEGSIEENKKCLAFMRSVLSSNLSPQSGVPRQQ